MEMVPNLVFALEQATLMAKQLPQTTDPTQTIQIYSALHAAHYHLSDFLSRTALPPPQPSLPPVVDNSLSSSSSAAADDASMIVGDDDAEIEQNSRANSAVERVEERMKEFFIRNKRQKRSLSPSAVVAVEKRRAERVNEFGKDDPVDFDPNLTRLNALELIYQFHS